MKTPCQPGRHTSLNPANSQGDDTLSPWAFPKLRVLDLFSGIGGFSLGLERTGGFETVSFCEIEPFPRRVLAKHWPEVPCYEDVRTLTAARLVADGITGIDVITGGFPCQDISTAGKRRGIGEGTRSGLYSEVIRLLGDIRPKYIILENVANLLAGPTEQPGGWFGSVLGDLAEVGYDAEWHCIPASYVGALHQRDRIWIVAYPNSDSLRFQGFQRPAARTWAKWHFNMQYPPVAAVEYMMGFPSDHSALKPSATP
jgi:DNA (cytosine-5)-methyltransferase 1